MWNWNWKYLATKRTESEWIEEAPITDFAGVCDAFSGPRLRPLIQENHFSTIDYVGLNRADIQVLLNLGNSDNIMVRWPPNLQFIQNSEQQFRNQQWRTNQSGGITITHLNHTVVFVRRHTERTQRAVHTIQTVHIAFALVMISMNSTVTEELFLQQRLQPWRPSVVFFLRSLSNQHRPKSQLN